MALDAKSQEEPAQEDDLAPMPEGEDLSVTVNTNEEITAEDLIVGDEEGDFEDVREDDYAFESIGKIPTSRGIQIRNGIRSKSALLS